MSSRARTVFSKVTSPRLERADAVQGRVADRDGLAQVEAQGVGCGLELGQGDDALERGGPLSELLQPVSLVGRLGHADTYQQQRGHQEQRQH